MKFIIRFLIVTMLFLTTLYGQKVMGQFYNVPVPEDLKALSSTQIQDSQTKTYENNMQIEGVVFTVRIVYDPEAKNESVYAILVSSNNKDINRKLAQTDFNPKEISICYSGEKHNSPDWFALMDCTVNYIRNL